MKTLDLVDRIVNYIPDKFTDTAFRIANDPEGLPLLLITPISYLAGLSAQAGAIGYISGKFTQSLTVGVVAASATVIAPLTVKILKLYRGKRF
jgi:hypothetical protein